MTDTLYVRNLPLTMAPAERKKLMFHFGASEVKINSDKGPMKCTAFVKFHTHQHARAALGQIHQLLVMSRRLIAVYAAKDADPSFDEDPIATLGTKEPEKTDEECFHDGVNDLNSISAKLGIKYPFNPTFRYRYPPANPTILLNISNALLLNENFYYQTLHLMNKLNMKAPFGPLVVPEIKETLNEFDFGGAEGDDASEEELADEAADASVDAHHTVPTLPVSRPPKRLGQPLTSAKRMKVQHKVTDHWRAEMHSKGPTELAVKVKFEDPRAPRERKMPALPFALPTRRPPKPAPIHAVSADPKWTPIDRPLDLKFMVRADVAPQASEKTKSNSTLMDVSSEDQQPAPPAAESDQLPQALAYHQRLAETHSDNVPSLPPGEYPEERLDIALEDAESSGDDNDEDNLLTRGLKRNVVFTVYPEPKGVRDDPEPPGPSELSQFDPLPPLESCVSVHELIRGQLNATERAALPIFQKYAPGTPAGKLYVKNLHRKTTETDLRNIFGAFVPRETALPRFDVKLMTGGRMKGQAFVDYADVNVAEQARRSVNGYVFNGRPIVVAFANS